MSPIIYLPLLYYNIMSAVAAAAELPPIDCDRAAVLFNNALLREQITVRTKSNKASSLTSVVNNGDIRLYDAYLSSIKNGNRGSEGEAEGEGKMLTGYLACWTDSWMKKKTGSGEEGGANE